MRKFAITYITGSSEPKQGSGLVTSWFTCRVNTKGTGLISESQLQDALTKIGAPKGIPLAINQISMED